MADLKMEAEIRDEFEKLGFDVIEIGHGVHHLGPGEHAVVVLAGSGSPIGTFTPEPIEGGSRGFQSGPPDSVITVAERTDPEPEPTTVFRAFCGLFHEGGGEGVDEFGAWRGPIRAFRAEADTDVLVHEHTDAGVEELLVP